MLGASTDLAPCALPLSIAPNQNLQIQRSKNKVAAKTKLVVANYSAQTNKKGQLLVYTSGGEISTLSSFPAGNSVDLVTSTVVV